MQRTLVRTLCDMHPGEEIEAGHSLRIQLDGRTVEVDLCDDHLAGMDPILSAGRSSKPATKRRRASSSAGKENSTEIRTWANSHGFEVGDRGRLPQAVLDAYASASTGSTPAKRTRARKKS